MSLAVITKGLRRGGRSFGAVGLGILVLGLAACQSGEHVSYNDRYQVSAEMRPYRATIPLPSPESGAQTWTIRMPAGFLEDYIRRGRTALSIQPNGALTGQAGAATTVLQQWLADRDIDAVVMPAPDGAPADSLTLSYDAYVAVVPECGDWSGGAGYNASNVEHNNFGCSVNRNIGLMLSDPGDLVRGRVPGPADGSRQGTVIQTYRAGGPLGTPVPPNESGSLTGLGD